MLDLHEARHMCIIVRRPQRQVAYLLAADKYCRLLLIRLDGGTQPVSLAQNGFLRCGKVILASEFG